MKPCFKTIMFFLVVLLSINSTAKAQQIQLFPPIGAANNIQTQSFNRAVDRAVRSTSTQPVQSNRDDILQIQENENRVQANQKKVKINEDQNIINSKLANKSVIEKMFDNELRQFGYNLFDDRSYLNLVNNISSDYKLRTGDKVKIYLWGDAFDMMGIAGSSSLEPVIDSIIDREGNLFVPNVGIIAARDLSIADVQRKIYASMYQNYSNFSVKVTVSQPRDFPIKVLGNVNKPGPVYINHAASLLDVLSLAGGIRKDGSLRTIVHINAKTKKKTIIDFYDVGINGNVNPIKLSQDDVVLIRPIGKVIGLSNGVNTPAIYEFKDNETLYDIVEFAGGLLPSVNKQEILINTYNHIIGEKTVKDTSISGIQSLRPQNGDLVVFKTLFEMAENTVTLEGNIKHPGQYEYFDGMRLSDLIKNDDELQIRTMTGQIVINRVYGKAHNVKSIPVNLEAFLSGSTNPKLDPMDIIKVYPSTDMSFIDVAGEIINPGMIPYKENMALYDILGSVEFSVNSNDIVVEITNKALKNGQKDLNFSPDKILYRNVENENSDEMVATTNELNLSLKNKPVKTVYLYDYLTKTRSIEDVKIYPGDTVLFRKIMPEEALRTVKLLGYVNKPGVYKIRPGMRITDVINMADGLSRNAYIKGMVFLRDTVDDEQSEALQLSSLETQDEIISKAIASLKYTEEGSSGAITDFLNIQKEITNIIKEKAAQKYGRVIIDIQNNDLGSIMGPNNLELQDGDEIIIPQVPNYVLVMGEVYNQSAIAYYPGQLARFYVDQVGGTTKRAKKKQIYILKANGSVVHPKNLNKLALDPGDTVIVPRKIKTPINIRGILRDIATITASTMQTVFILDRL